MKPWNCGARHIFLIIPLPLLAQIRVKMTKAPFDQFESYFSSLSFFNFFNRQGTATPSSSYRPVHGWHPSVMNSWKSSHWSQSVGSLSFLFQQPRSIDRTITNCDEFEILPLLLRLFSCSVVFNSLWPHGLQHARLPCPSLSPGACSNSCLLSRWCHPTILSSVVPFSSCLQCCPVSGSFLMSWLITSGGQSIGVSTSASILPMNIQDWFPLGWTGLISLQSKGLSRVLSNTTVQKHQPSLWSKSHIHTWLLEKP